MADQQSEQNRQIQLRIDESKMQTTYANTFRTSTTQDEVVIDYGMNLPVPTQDGQPAVVFNVGSRIVTNWTGAKRLAISLGQIIRQYEERHGEIKLPQSQPQQGATEAQSAPRLTDD